MPTFHETEEIKRAHLNAILEVQAKYEGRAWNVLVTRHDASVLIFPFAAIDGRPPMAAVTRGDVAGNSAHNCSQQLGNYADAPKPNLMVSGIALLLALVAMYVVVRKIWN